jgi:hypothetical protein
MLTLCDSIRVADDMGKVQFQLKVMHMPIMGWKGSWLGGRGRLLRTRGSQQGLLVWFHRR